MTPVSKMETTNRGFEKASDKLTEEQLNRPLDEVVVEAPTESVPETPVETAPEPETAVVVVEETEEEKVPKSRFLTMHQRAVEAEKALRAFEAERTIAPVETVIPDDEALHQYYVKTFGEGELTETLYKNELARFASIEEKAADRAFERLSKREQEQEKIVNQRVESFDHAFEELAIATGKTDFTDDEQVAMLDIVESYSPKDKEGRLLGDFLLPLDKAYEIYQLQHETSAKPKKAERNAVAALAGARSEGSSAAGASSEWQPGQERRWWDKA